MSVATLTEWQRRADELAAFTLASLVNRSDRHGAYGSNGAFTGNELTRAKLRRHFKGESIAGIHSTSADETCRWLGIDIDNHDADDELATSNFDHAAALLNRLTELGIAAALEDSNGDGGYHVWILFAEPVPAKAVFRLGQWLVGDNDFETFPKQAALSGKGLGNWLRLPGRHHSRDHWSRFWGDGEWLDESESVDAFLNLSRNDPAVLACVPREEPKPATSAPIREYVDHSSATNSHIEEAERILATEPWSNLLEQEGWQDNGGGTWTRPGKNDGVSATLNYNGNGLFHVFSTAAGLPADESFGKFRFLLFSRGMGDADQVAFAKSLLPTESAAAGVQTAVSQPNEKTRTFHGESVASLWALADEPVEWLVQDVMSSEQPSIFGAKQKSLKTTLLVDLAVSLATGFPWLNRFEIPNRKRVLFIVGEASKKAAIRRLRKAAEKRNLDAKDIGDNIRIEAATFPNLPNASDCISISETIEKHAIDVVILDPLYMGLQGVNTANLTEVGPALRMFKEWCQPANVIIAHHVKKSASYDDAPNLEDLSQAGIAEFAGNFWMMGRMSEYQGDGQHELAVRYGGRDEQFGLLKLDFDEQKWAANFTSLTAHREHEQQRRENEKVGEMKQRIRRNLARATNGMSETSLADACGTKKTRDIFCTSVEELESEKCIVRDLEFKAANKRTCVGFRIV